MWAAAWANTFLAVGMLDVSFDLLNNATNFRATELLAGCVLAILVSGGYLTALTSRQRLSSMLGAVALIGLLALIVFGETTSNMTLISTWIGVSVCTAVLIATLQASKPTFIGRILSVKPFVAIGIVSYGLYLWHFPIMVSIDALVGLESSAAKIFSLVITGICVVVSYYWIERPFLRMKDGLWSNSNRLEVLPTARGQANDVGDAPMVS
jgi:peptidoglycan/LPS O-acetylase OafA/YrhL